jgi:alpha,alpha-trehalose phosphorylase
VQQHTYPLEAWCIRETQFDTASHFLDETLFALGNGYIGLRGTGEEGYSGPAGTSLDGTYLNGFYESEPIQYPEAAYGLAKVNQFMLNVPNAKGVELWLDDERFDPLTGTVQAYERVLDFRTGVLTRTVEWTSPQGRSMRVHSRRLVCFENKHLFAIECEVTSLNFSGGLRLVSALDGAVKNQEAGDDPRVGSAVSGPALHMIDAEQTASFAALVQKTHNSGFTLVSATETELSVPLPATIAREGQRLTQAWQLQVDAGQSVKLTKFGSYYSSRDYDAKELMWRSQDTLANARAAGFDDLRLAQEQYLADFWARPTSQIDGDDALQQGMRFNQFHLLQSVGATAGPTSPPRA